MGVEKITWGEEEYRMSPPSFVQVEDGNADGQNTITSDHYQEQQ